MKISYINLLISYVYTLLVSGISDRISNVCCISCKIYHTYAIIHMQYQIVDSKYDLRKTQPLFSVNKHVKSETQNPKNQWTAPNYVSIKLYLLPNS